MQQFARLKETRSAEVLGESHCVHRHSSFVGHGILKQETPMVRVASVPGRRVESVVGVPRNKICSLSIRRRPAHEPQNRG